MPALDLTPLGLAKKLLTILHSDLENHLIQVDDYLHNRHADPYMPDSADAEYKLLAKRSVSNWMPLLVSTPCQALYVDTFRRGGKATATGVDNRSPEMAHWQRSRMDARQHSVHRGAVGYGHAFTVTEKTKKGSITRGLSPLRTSALFEDPANDIVPYAALTVVEWNAGDEPGSAVLWTGKQKFLVSFSMISDLDSVRVGQGVSHGATECPVTRFAAYTDLEGRTTGVVEPMIRLQDRINQTVFDLLVVQSGGAFKVRWTSGMAPPLRQVPVYGNPLDETEITDWVPERDAQGQTVPLPININAKRMLFAKDPNTRFGTMDETPLDGYIASIDMSVRHFSALGQIPPHHMLGQIANLSADALQAAETSLLRMVDELRSSFGESWERVFQLAAQIDGTAESADDVFGEVIWRDMEQKSLAQAADALGKMKENLGIPARGLWPRVPNVTENELATWEDLAEQEPEALLGSALSRSAPAARSDTSLDAAA